MKHEVRIVYQYSALIECRNRSVFRSSRVTENETAIKSNGLLLEEIKLRFNIRLYRYGNRRIERKMIWQRDLWHSLSLRNGWLGTSIYVVFFMWVLYSWHSHLFKFIAAAMRIRCVTISMHVCKHFIDSRKEINTIDKHRHTYINIISL